MPRAPASATVGEIAPRFLIRARAVVTGLSKDDTPCIEHGAAILVDRGKIVEIGPAVALIAANPELAVTGGDDHVAIPGLVNAHHHQGLTPLQLGVPTSPLETWLPRFLGMPAIDPRLDTLYSAVEILESGATTVQHIQGGLFGAPDTWGDTADAVMTAYVEAGMRASWCAMIRDRNRMTFEGDAAFLAELPDDLATWLATRITFAPVAEAMHFMQDTHARWAARAMPDLRAARAREPALVLGPQPAGHGRNGAGPRGTAAHASRRDEVAGRERAARNRRLIDRPPAPPRPARSRHDAGPRHLVAAVGPRSAGGARCSICHNPSSGLRLASGIAPVNAYRARGIPVALGIDESGVNDDRDMLQEMRMAWLLHREPGLFRNRPSSGAVLRMATENGANTTGFAGKIGRLVPGMDADVVLLSVSAIARGFLHPDLPILDAIVERAKEGAVDKVFVGGTLCVDGGRVTRIDRDGLMAEIGAQLAAALDAAPREMAVRLSRAVAEHHRLRGETDSPVGYVFNRWAERG